MSKPLVMTSNCSITANTANADITAIHYGSVSEGAGKLLPIMRYPRSAVTAQGEHVCQPPHPPQLLLSDCTLWHKRDVIIKRIGLDILAFSGHPKYRCKPKMARRLPQPQTTQFPGPASLYKMPYKSMFCDGAELSLFGPQIPANSQTSLKSPLAKCKGRMQGCKWSNNWTCRRIFFELLVFTKAVV